jgi:hypothetical protein
MIKNIHETDSNNIIYTDENNIPDYLLVRQGFVFERPVFIKTKNIGCHKNTIDNHGNDWLKTKKFFQYHERTNIQKNPANADDKILGKFPSQGS